MTVDETVIISQSEEIKLLSQKTLIIFGEKQKDSHHQHRVHGHLFYLTAKIEQVKLFTATGEW